MSGASPRQVVLDGIRKPAESEGGKQSRKQHSSLVSASGSALGVPDRGL